jgi:cytidylate kinase
MPIIAMTREMGSLGKDVADIVADRVGKPVVYHEIIDNLATKMRLRKSHVIRFLDGKSGIWERLTTDKTSMAIYTVDETLALAESEAISVIRGWGAAHLLRPIRHVICVRVCAPVGVRVQRMMERLNTDDEEFVANEIRISEEAITAITRRHFDVSWQHSDRYDLVLNTERVSVEECADELMALVNDAEFQETGQSRQMLRNLALESHVRAALRTNPRTANAQISIHADHGTVTLTGIVNREQELVDAAAVVATVTGVKKVVI